MIAAGVGGAVQFGAVRAFDALHVMAGGQAIGAEIFGDALQILELHGLIAAHARDRRRAGKIGVGEIFHHRLTEAAFVIEHVVRKADRIGDAARVVNVLSGAARARLVHRRAVVIELQRDADDVVALARQHRRDDGRIHPARHRRDDARFAPAAWRSPGN